MLFITASLAVGIAAVAAAGTMLVDGAVGRLLGLPAPLVRGGAIAVLLAIGGLLAVCARPRRYALGAGGSLFRMVVWPWCNFA